MLLYTCAYSSLRVSILFVCSCGCAVFVHTCLPICVLHKCVAASCMPGKWLYPFVVVDICFCMCKCLDASCPVGMRVGLHFYAHAYDVSLIVSRSLFLSLPVCIHICICHGGMEHKLVRQCSKQCSPSRAPSDDKSLRTMLLWLNVRTLVCSYDMCCICFLPIYLEVYMHVDVIIYSFGMYGTMLFCVQEQKRCCNDPCPILLTLCAATSKLCGQLCKVSLVFRFVLLACASTVASYMLDMESLRKCRHCKVLTVYWLCCAPWSW